MSADRAWGPDGNHPLIIIIYRLLPVPSHLTLLCAWGRPAPLLLKSDRHATGEEIMRVREMLAKKKAHEVVTISTAADIGAAVRLLMRHTIGGLPVVKPDGTLVGFISERDVVRGLNRGTEGITHTSIEEIT